MSESTFLVGIGGTLGGLAALVGLVGVVFEPLLVFLALPLGVAGYVIWYHGTGKMADRARRVEERNARAHGPEAQARARARGARRATGEDSGTGSRWADPEWRERRERARQFVSGGQTRVGGPGPGPGPGTGARNTGTDRAPSAQTGPSTAEAYRILDVDPESDADTVRRAYRERVKQVHPDTEDGDEETFKRVTEAYETLKKRGQAS